jgi:prepilin-type N-terminal cleavage/methylation domain-containing protein
LHDARAPRTRAVPLTTAAATGATASSRDAARPMPMHEPSPPAPAAAWHARCYLVGDYAMSRSHARGFSLVEMAIVILVMGLVFAFSVPAYQRVSNSYQLKGATENIAAELRLAREKAIATGMDQPMHFTPNYLNSDYHIHYPSGFIPAKWKLPRGVTYYSIGVSPTLTRDGRASTSGMIILQDTRGNRDTVSIQMSGLVLTK